MANDDDDDDDVDDDGTVTSLLLLLLHMSLGDALNRQQHLEVLLRLMRQEISRIPCARALVEYSS